MNNKFLQVKISKIGSISVIDRKTGKVWEQRDSPFLISCWDVIDCALKEEPINNSNDCSIRLIQPDNKRTVFVYDVKKLGIRFQAEYALLGNCLKLCIPISRIKEYKTRFVLMGITPLPMFGGVSTGEKGYMLLPNSSGTICYFDKKVSREHRDMIYGPYRWQPNYTTMPVFGIVHRDSAFLGIVTNGEFDTEVITRINKEPDNINSIYPSFHYRYEKSDKIDGIDRVVRYYFLAKEEANYVGMAKTYRNYLLKEKKLEPLKERIKKNRVLNYYYQAYNDIRIVLGRKAHEQGGEGSGKGKFNIYTSFSEAKSIIKAVKECGINKATFLLVGWTYDGADGAYPTKFPPDTRLGGEKGLSELIQYTKSLGYQIVSWDNYTDSYKISPDWNPSYVQRDRDNQLTRGGTWAGGKAYNICPSQSIKFAQRDFPRMKQIGFNGVWLIDAMPLPLGACFNKEHNHPHTKRTIAEGYKKIASLARKTFGGCHVEIVHDYMAGSIDAISCLYINSQENLALTSNLAWREFYKYFLDKFVPFYQIAYHGIIQYHHYPVHFHDKFFGSIEKGILKEIEYGVMPRAEICYKAKYEFANCYHKSLPLMKKQYQIQCKKLGYLQLEFIKNHREIAPEVFETIYSDGTKVICNYKEDICILENKKGKEVIKI